MITYAVKKGSLYGPLDFVLPIRKIPYLPHKPRVYLNTTGHPPRVPEGKNEFRVVLRMRHSEALPPTAWQPTDQMKFTWAWGLDSALKIIATEFR